MPNATTNNDNRTVADVMIEVLADGELALSDIVAAVRAAGLEVGYDAVRKRVSRDKRFSRRTRADGSVHVHLSNQPARRGAQQRETPAAPAAREIDALRDQLARLTDAVKEMQGLLLSRVSNRPAVTPSQIRDAAVRIGTGESVCSRAVRLQVGRPAKNWGRDVRRAVSAGVVDYDPNTGTITPRYAGNRSGR